MSRHSIKLIDVKIPPLLETKVFKKTYITETDNEVNVRSKLHTPIP